MVKRLTEKPFRIRKNVTESAANTLTEADIELPTAPIVSRGKMQAVEIMKVISECPPATFEEAQANRVDMYIAKDTQTAIGGINSEDVLWSRTRDCIAVGARTAEAVGINPNAERVQFDDMTDGDGNGTIVIDKTIKLGIKGIGLPAAVGGAVALVCHLVELDTEDAIMLALELTD